MICARSFNPSFQDSLPCRDSYCSNCELGSVYTAAETITLPPPPDGNIQFVIVNIGGVVTLPALPLIDPRTVPTKQFKSLTMSVQVLPDLNFSATATIQSKVGSFILDTNNTQTTSLQLTQNTASVFKSVGNLWIRLT